MPGLAQSFIDGRSSDSHPLGHFVVRHVFVVVEQNGFPKIDRERMNEFDEFRVGGVTVRRRLGIGDWDTMDVLVFVEIDVFSAEEIDAGVGRNPSQPSPDRAGVSKVFPASDCAQERLLRCIFGIARVAQP